MNRRLPLFLLSWLAAACAATPAEPTHTDGVRGPSAPTAPAGRPAAAAPAPATVPWLDPRGTSIVGFGILRVVPEPGKTATVGIRYREVPDGYSSTGNLQLFVLPADAFARRNRAYAGDFLAFSRTKDDEAVGDDYALRTAVSGIRVARETTLLVAYGPWTAPDAGRPAGDVPVFRLDVEVEGGESAWIESEAGELITTNWTARPEVARGSPCRDPLTGEPLWIEVRPMILYDARLARAADEPIETPPGTASAADLRAEADRLDQAGRAVAAADRRDRAADLDAVAARSDRRLVLTRDLVEKFRRVPIRWR